METFENSQRCWKVGDKQQRSKIGLVTQRWRRTKWKEDWVKLKEKWGTSVKWKEEKQLHKTEMHYKNKMERWQLTAARWQLTADRWLMNDDPDAGIGNREPGTRITELGSPRCEVRRSMFEMCGVWCTVHGVRWECWWLIAECCGPSQWEEHTCNL